MKKLLTLGADATAPVRRNPSAGRLSPAERKLLQALAAKRGWVPVAKLAFQDETRSALMVRGYIAQRLNGPSPALAITPAGRAAIDGQAPRTNPTRRSAKSRRARGIWIV